MELRQIEYFMRIYEEGSFTAAAESLYVTQPALSKAIKRLEDELNVALFEMSGKRLLITEAGEILYRQGKKIAEDYGNMLGLLNGLQSHEYGSIRIDTSFQRGALFWLYDTIEKYGEMHPKICFELVEKESQAVTRSVLAGEADIGLTISFGEEEKISNLERTVLLKSNLWLISREDNPLISKKNIEYEDFKGLNIFTTYADLNRSFVNECMKQGFQPNISFITTQLDMILSLVLKNRGVALVGFTPEKMLPYMEKYNYPKLEKQQEIFARRKIESEKFSYKMVMYTRKDVNRNPLMKNFVSYLEDSLKSLLEDSDRHPLETEFYDNKGLAEQWKDIEL